MASFGPSFRSLSVIFIEKFKKMYFYDIFMILTKNDNSVQNAHKHHQTARTDSYKSDMISEVQKT